MNTHEYELFTNNLQHNLERDPRVLGLMAAGSMAHGSHEPDEWSDHDFWVVVEPGSEAWFFEHHDWLPASDRIVLYVRHTMHNGVKVVYSDGHLLEFAVSDRRGLSNARVNDYRLLIDRAELATDLAQIRAATEAEYQQWIRDDVFVIGEFITNLLVGTCRCRRGEYLSGRQLITFSAMYSLLRLIPKHIPTERPEALDNLDPLRRFETAYPEIGVELNRLLRLDPVEAAVGLLDLADNLLRDKMSAYPTEAVEVIRSRILA